MSVPSMPFDIHELAAADVAMMRAMLAVFATAFDDAESYLGNPPSTAYLTRLLARDSFIALAALKDGRVVGGLAAYELHKFEQERSEIYIYDLAVLAEHRREGIATALITALQAIAARRGAWVIFVQADSEEDDEPARSLYSKLGTREDVFHFDIPIA